MKFLVIFNYSAGEQPYRMVADVGDTIGITGAAREVIIRAVDVQQIHWGDKLIRSVEVIPVDHEFLA